MVPFLHASSIDLLSVARLGDLPHCLFEDTFILKIEIHLAQSYVDMELSFFHVLELWNLFGSHNSGNLRSRLIWVRMNTCVKHGI